MRTSGWGQGLFGDNILIFKFFRAFIVICAVYSLFLGTVQAKEDPNLLLGEAITLYDEAQELSGEDRIRKLLEVNELLTEIETEHPDSILTNFIKSGRAIGAIDVAALRKELGDTGEIKLVEPFGGLPEVTKQAIISVAQRACAASDCADEVAASLSGFILEVAFTDMDSAVNVEKLRRLFTNPGQLGGNLERVQVFEQMLDDPNFLANIDARIARGLVGYIGSEAAKDFAIGVVTNVATEVVADWLEGQGKTEEAELARTWIEQPSIDIGLALQGAATASSASAGAGAAIIWAKNAYAFVQLGQKTLEDEAAGATRDQQLAKIGSDIDSLHRSLITGKTSGPLFSEDLGVTVTPRMAEGFRQTLLAHYEHQKFWLASDDAILLEAFGLITETAKVAAKTFNTVLNAIPEGPSTRPSGTESANSTNALPGDVNSIGPTEAADQETVPESNQETLIDTAPLLAGIYVNDPALCRSPSETYEIWERIIHIKKQRYMRRGTVCSIRSAKIQDGETKFQGSCDGEGIVSDVSWAWSIETNERFVESLSGKRNVWMRCSPNSRLVQFYADNPNVAGSFYESEAEEEIVASTEVEDSIAPVGGSPLVISAKFFDPRYPTSWDQGAQHLGIDLPAPKGTTVRSPIAGQVVLNQTAGTDAFKKYLIIKDQDGLEHVFGHLDSNLAARQQVEIGDGIGAIVTAGTGPHVHWGINQGSITSTISGPWGFGRAPLSATEADARAKGWLDPEDWFASRSSGPSQNGIEFFFPKEELDQVATLSNDGELRSTGFDVEISDGVSVNCTHWVNQGAGAASEYGITTWEALLPALQCNVWSDNGDGSSGLVPNIEVSAKLSGLGALVIRLGDAEFFHNEQQGNQNACAFSIQNQVLNYNKKWFAECQSRRAARPDRIEFSALADGLYGRSFENCTIDPETVGDRWYTHFRSIRKPEISGGYEASCSVTSTSSEGQSTMLNVSCNREGELSEEQWKWQILSDTSFTDMDAYHAETEFKLCEADTVPISSENEWTSAIVHTGGYGREELTACIWAGEKSTYDCLKEDSASDETLRFARARASEGGEGPEVPVDFKELGQVDIAFLDSFVMNQNEWEYFVNTSPESISVPMYPEQDIRQLASRGDRRAQGIIQQFPEATAWKPFVGGMRVLPNGHQRFSTIVYWTEDCRACPIVGYNVATVDYDQTGRFRAYETRGVFDNRQYSKFMSMTANDLRRDDAAVQFYLNLRGYDAGPMDGAFGPKTRAALADFQRENGVNLGTGQIDQDSLQALANYGTFFDNGGGQSTPSDVGNSGEVESGEPGKYESPWEYMEWVQVASRQTLDEARMVSKQFASTFPKTQIFKASNGWFAITVDYIDDHFDNEKRLAELIGLRQVPSDSILTSGSSFVERYPPGVNTPWLSPEFVFATVIRDTKVGGETQQDGSRYEGQEVIKAGTQVGVSGRYNNDCNLAWHGLAIVPCSDLSGIDDIRDAALTSSANALVSIDEANPVDDEDALNKDLSAAERNAQINSDTLADKLIAVTKWKNTTEERELLKDMAVVSGSDFRRLPDIDKLSRLTGILNIMEKRADVPDGSFETLNFARNRRMGEHPSRQVVIDDSSWSLNTNKDFHIIGISEPDRVEKYTRPDGAEAVFYNDPQKGWSVMQDGKNNATFNYVPDIPVLDFGVVNDILNFRVVNDNYQHLILDIIPWVIWGASPEDETSISQRLALFENSTLYRVVGQGVLVIKSGKRPDGEPVSTNGTSDQVDLRTAAAPELGALLLSSGVKNAHVGFVSGDASAQQQEMNRLIGEYQGNPPVVITPDLPISGRYDAKEGILRACTANTVKFPVDLIRGPPGYGDRYEPASFRILPSDPIRLTGSWLAICIVKMGNIGRVEAEHGKGDIERFGLIYVNGLALNFKMSADQASIFTSAAERGEARLGVKCEMKPGPFANEGVGTCVPKTVTLKAIDFKTGDSQIMDFSAGGQVFSPTSGVITNTTPIPVPDADLPRETLDRASWSFATNVSGEAAVRDIVEAFDGTTAEILLGYENAFPFQTSSVKKLAVAVFGALPDQQVGTRAGTEQGFGSFILKSWSDLNDYYFVDEPEPGIASAVVGIIDGIRILSVRELSASSCEWSVTYRIWLRDMTPFGEALEATSKSDGYTFEACFRTTRDGFEIASYRYVDG